MAKIRLENLLSELRRDPQIRAKNGDLSPINQLRTNSDSVINRTRIKLTVEEASQLSAELFGNSTAPEDALLAQGAGLTEDRVKNLLSEE